MMGKIAKSFLFVVLAAAVGAVSASAQTFDGSISGGSVARGGSARGTVIMNIPAGLHVNSNRPSSQYAIATAVRLSVTGATVSGVNYPRGKNRKFQFSEDAINVYEGRVAFGFTVKVPPGFRGNTVRVRATVRYQACTDEVCYPPKNKEITITARVR
jgi:hypothetical protein